VNIKKVEREERKVGNRTLKDRIKKNEQMRRKRTEKDWKRRREKEGKRIEKNTKNTIGKNPVTKRREKGWIKKNIGGQ
jgi:hypothetical protein